MSLKCPACVCVACNITWHGHNRRNESQGAYVSACVWMRGGEAIGGHLDRHGEDEVPGGGEVAEQQVCSKSD